MEVQPVTVICVHRARVRCSRVCYACVALLVVCACTAVALCVLCVRVVLGSSPCGAGLCVWFGCVGFWMFVRSVCVCACVHGFVVFYFCRQKNPPFLIRIAGIYSVELCWKCASIGEDNTFLFLNLVQMGLEGMRRVYG